MDRGLNLYLPKGTAFSMLYRTSPKAAQRKLAAQVESDLSRFIFNAAANKGRVPEYLRNILLTEGKIRNCVSQKIALILLVLGLVFLAFFNGACFIRRSSHFCRSPCPLRISLLREVLRGREPVQARIGGGLQHAGGIHHDPGEAVE